MSKIHFLSFADSSLSGSSVRLKKNIKELNIFESITILNELSLPRSFVQHFRDVFVRKTRGFGYWSWKPELIYGKLQNLTDGDYLIYSDIGNHFNNNQKDALQKCLTILERADLPISCPALPSTYIEKNWTKKEVLDYFQVISNDAIINSPQFEANFLIIKNGFAARGFINRWRNIFYERFSLVDDSKELIQDEDFVDHRHDQSIFSVLGKLEGITPFSNDLDSFVLRKRDKVFSKSYFTYGWFLIKNGLIFHRLAKEILFLSKRCRD